jgi:putative peptidoglycan lipid II flippase
MTSRVLGVVRESVLASYFGATDAMDAYRFAFRIPNLLRDLFAEGAMSAAFVPTFTKRLTASGKDSALRLGTTVTNALLLITGVVVVIGMFAAPWLVRTFASEYAAVPGKIALTIELTRILMPFLTFIALAAAATGMLNTLHHFFLPALSPAVFNVASVVCLVALYGLMPGLGFDPVMAIAIGALVGAFLQWAVQLPLLRREGLAYHPVVEWSDPGLRRVLALLGPGTLGVAATQVNVLVSTFLATAEGTGALSWIDYAFRLMYLPIGLFGVSIATATLPTVSRQVSADDLSAVRRTLADSLSLMLALSIPATVGLAVLATPIVRVMYEHGRFTPDDTMRTAAALQLYAIGLVGYSVVRIISPVFYALGASRTPVAVSVTTVLVNAALSVALVTSVREHWGARFGYLGLPLATSVAALFNSIVLSYLLRRRLKGIEGARLSGTALRVFAAAAVMGVVAAVTDELLARSLPGGSLFMDALRLSITIGLALCALAASAYVLRIREFRMAFDSLARRLRRGRR